MNCRFCDKPLETEFVDLVNAPASNSYLSKEQLNEPESYFPLKLFVCDNCFLVQVDEYKKSDDIFNQEYAYFSSCSSSWLEHSKKYVDMISERIGLDSESLVVELASNDGYLLQYFLPKNIPVLGIEPSSSVARVAREKNIDTIEDFFGLELAQKLKDAGKCADLIIGNNVFAHVPNVNDFISGMKHLLKEEGLITLEFPHLMQLVRNNQFDTIYHEHFSYYSLHTAKNIFNAHGLEIIDVDRIPTHGGSLRIYGTHKSDNNKIKKSVIDLLNEEEKAGMLTPAYYQNFQEKANKVKNDFLKFLIKAKEEGKSVAAYGAAAKGNTLLNFCGIKKDIIKFVVDRSPFKQNRFLPGSHIPVVTESILKQEKPDYIIIFPWNIKDEIMQQLDYSREWNARFVTAIPELTIE